MMIRSQSATSRASSLATALNFWSRVQLLSVLEWQPPVGCDGSKTPAKQCNYVARVEFRMKVNYRLEINLRRLYTFCVQMELVLKVEWHATMAVSKICDFQEKLQFLQKADCY